MVTLNSNHILKTIADRGDEFSALGVRRIGLFGSAARGEMKPDSDLDFLVEMQPKSFDAYMDVKFLLEKAFGRRVDLVTVEALKPSLKEATLRETIYARRLCGSIEI
jgi:uncharacterized protein